ncbi:MAG: hypothetical protein UU73_C0002G0006 [Candidatus Daviesbacteria bacterium GW2011_GWA1_41_61]|uniref:Amine oxidase domain-containing protein n=1 Tax=Candidatus Daviesbacteria bacterium GW2011_GWA2_40_9 TaxID=1618424 RepID=A0A0G0X343_9BACT|nr:MAG: hypothetical protein UU26_C0008G0027 [Candidatus Daviesbacteria bacterium GW2011_GWC1_40_9]KKR82032.1 MAG: hypothetical protein UU29_C0019G0006 [Candidatus Daviesbacteria bacterium GW2011_GWA2_40_9]KKR93666.1 MAG: hypothetical protein UU44_C0001G0006 [Candidatus Daviesbacteria bacterium GW2011_GWB1_41_15]KKS15132.1 MAG: hypothetical protein UU73_C0002G0006 [Candidatus Daviesbacteria bacterium GW2011_GWA1_41_61]
MKIAVLGAGFTGLTAALRLLQTGQEVTVFEKESEVGGLAAGFKDLSWQWTLEKAYHHWFTNDASVLNLAKELNHPVAIKRPRTDVYVNGKAVPFDSPSTIISFPYFSLTDKLRTGLGALFLKLLPNQKLLEGQKALPWIRKVMGAKSTKLIWDPLFDGKFGKFKEEIALTWFWARIKKRTPSLSYPEGGFQTFLEKLADEISKLGGDIKLRTKVSAISHQSSARYAARRVVRLQLKTKDKKQITQNFDKAIVTLPSPIFAKIASGLPKDYIKRISSIPHLHTLNLILILKKPFLNGTYWLNITDQSFPFLVLAEHTNFMDPQHYGGQHILYIGNYLPPDHPYLKMTAEELLKVFDPYLSQINKNYKLSILNCKLFIAPFAQPVVTTDYPKLIPQFQTPLKDVYLANLDMVYPWDRGTNYAIEMGEKIAKLIVSR